MENHDVRKIISTESGDEAAGEPPIKSFTEEVTPNKYSVCIEVDDWEQDLSTYRCEKTVPGIHESCICYVYPDDDMTMNKASDRKAAQQLLNDIYKNEKLEIKTDTCKIICRFIGNKPTEAIYLDLEELPFFDVPASKFGL